MIPQENNTQPAPMDFNPDDFEMKSYRDGNGNLITKEEYARLQESQAATAGDDGITDVAFVEIKKEEQKPFFNPVEFLTNALHQAGFTDADLWHKDIDPRAETAEDEKERIFFANRALRLFLAEVGGDRDNITPRMLLADGIDGIKWIALMEQGVIPWLLNQFDKKGKRVTPEVEADPVGCTEPGSVEQQPTEQWDPTGEMVTQRDELNVDQAVVVGVDAAAEGTSDQSAHMPVKWDVPILKGDQIPDTQEDGHFLQERSSSDDNGEER